MITDDLRKKYAFTLAEVLITLGIIGVVAALTIPSLMANYQKTSEVAALKKAYAEITEAIKLMANDHGCADDLKCVGLFSNADDNTADNIALGNEFKKYFKLSKDCGATDNPGDEGNCLSDSAAYNYDGFSDGDRDNLNSHYGNYYKFMTADGFGVALWSYSCDNIGYAVPNSHLNISEICAEIVVDVNGLKGPNNFGRDIFDFYITNGKGPALYPNGGSEELDADQAWIDSSGDLKFCYDQDTSGLKCAARIIEQGWQMKY